MHPVLAPSSFSLSPSPFPLDASPLLPLLFIAPTPPPLSPLFSLMHRHECPVCKEAVDADEVVKDHGFDALISTLHSPLYRLSFLIHSCTSSIC